MKVQYDFQVPETPDSVVRALCSEALASDNGEERPDIVSTSHRMLSSTEDRIEFEVKAVEYQRTKTGKLDTSATVRSSVRYLWDAKDSTLSWSYSQEQESRVELSGRYRIIPGDSGTQVVYEAEVSVGIPVIGKMIAKQVAKSISDDRERVIRLVSRHAAQA